MKKKRKEVKNRPWLRKPVEEKKVQDYYYVKAKHKEEAKKVIKETLKQFI
jgi:transcription antitermination factor NusG